MSRQALVTTFKALLAIAILFVIGRQFKNDLTSDAIREIEFHPGWLVASAVLYLAGLTTWGVFWFRLLRLFDQNASLPIALRAYFLGQLGKYIPGKAWSLWIRGDQVAGPGDSFGVAVVTSFYEVLTSMASGALVAAVVFFFNPPHFHGYDFPPHFTGLILLACCGVPLLPGVFNLLAGRLARRFPSLDAFHVPKMRLPILLQGIVLASVGWGLMGLSVWACLASVIDPCPPLTMETWATYCAIVGLAYVLGFAAFVLPSGVGVREWVLVEFLLFAGPKPTLAAAVLLMRLAWTAGEIVFTGVLAVAIRRRKPLLQTQETAPAPER